MNLNKLENIQSTSKIKTYYDFAKENIKDYIKFPVVIVDGIVTSLEREITEGASVEFLDRTSKWGNRTYTKTLSFIFTMAFRNLFPDRKADLNHYIGSGLYIDFKDNLSLSLEEIDRISDEMINIIEKQMPIHTYMVTLDEAKDIFKNSDEEITELLNTIPNGAKIGIVECGDFRDLNYSILAPNTNYVDDFKLMQYYPGILLIMPNKKNGFNVDNYKEMPKFAKVFQNSTSQYKMLGLNTLSEINQKILNGQEEKIIKISETIFDKSLINVSEKIHSDKDIKIILISGPTSSGKTTFTNKLKVHLEVLGYSPIPISMDDYFLNREDTPLGEDGEYDFESPYAVDLDLFNKDMYRLLNMEKIHVRKFDFLTGVGEYTEDYIIPGENKIIMIEGIHALNPIISKLIPEKNKYKIYISALNQVNLDAHNRVSTTDGRLIRRSVRDEKYRGYNIEETFKLWENVRKAEEMYIFPYQEEADILINSSLPYETNVLKKHVEPMLKTIGRESVYYNEARNLLEMLSYFVSIEDDNLVSSESLLREFIGR